ncbi:MAG: TonB-dependent receptor [Azospirillaceae bacterium]|nr:TonB-dependent receptor [Azospirillaceae bacterium]
MNVRTCLFMAGTSALVLASPALAQTAAPAAVPARPADIGIEEIVVTAQKFSQNLQEVPISVTALNADALAKSGVVSLDSVQQYAPGLSMATVGSGFVSYTYMRGSGTNQLDAGSDPSVAFFVDEVYVTGTAGAQFALYDIDQVEVLKGPQGTLFGRNAAAGAISITTKRPTADFSADASVNVGNYDLRSVNGAVSGPLTSDGELRFRLAGTMQNRGAYTENLAGGADPGTIKSGGVRGQLEYVHGDMSLLLTADGYSARNGMTNQFLSSANKATFLTPAAIAALPSGESFYAHYYNVDGFENQDVGDVTARLEWDLSFAKLTAISAYRSNKFSRKQDQDGTIADSYELDSAEQDKSFSQELRLSKQTANVNWVAGLFYYNDDTTRQDTVITGPDYPPVALRDLTSIDHSQLHTDSIAGFGQATYFFTPDWSLTAGGRWTHDEKEDNRWVSRFGAPTYYVDPNASWSSFDPAVTLSFQPSPDMMAYASWRQGFKSGGFQTLLPATAAVAATPFKPEKVNSYEVGFKSEWLDHHLRTNVAVFYADITDQQILRVLGNSTNVIDNAGSTHTAGVDGQIDLVLGAVRLNAAMTYQQARFGQYMTGTTSYAGKTQLRSPDFSGSFGAEYTLPVWTRDLTLRGEYVYQTESFFDAANTRVTGLYQPAYGLVNARAALHLGDWEIAAWAKNITDEHYYRNIAVSGATGLAVPGDPATYGVSLRWSM